VAIKTSALNDSFGVAIRLPNMKRESGDCNEDGSHKGRPGENIFGETPLGEANDAHRNHGNPEKQYRKLPESNPIHDTMCVRK
jgi:hypothetical protein